VPKRPPPAATAPVPPRPPALADQYPNLGTRGITVSSSLDAEVSVQTSRLEGWLVAGGLLLASAVAMAIYLVVLHR